MLSMFSNISASITAFYSFKELQKPTIFYPSIVVIRFMEYLVIHAIAHCTEVFHSMMFYSFKLLQKVGVVLIYCLGQGFQMDLFSTSV